MTSHEDLRPVMHDFPRSLTALDALDDTRGNNEGTDYATHRSRLRVRCAFRFRAG
jgi:hypothetical protein